MKGFLVFNNTDEVLAAPYLMSRGEASKFIMAFPKRFNGQGYYLTACGVRISPEDVELVIVDEDLKPVGDMSGTAVS